MSEGERCRNVRLDAQSDRILQRLAQRHDGNLSMTVRQLLKEEAARQAAAARAAINNQQQRGG